MHGPFGPETARVQRFLARLERLSLDDLARVMVAWRASVGERWFAADEHLGQAVERTNRFGSRLRMLDEIHEIFRRAPWFKPGAPDGRTPGNEATAQYTTSVASSALLVGDTLAAADLDVLYAPFSTVIPIESLDGSGVAQRLLPADDHRSSA